MINQFVKLFEHDMYGQICVMSGMDEEGCPELRAFVQPAGLGVCSIAMSFEDSDDGYAAADSAFAKVDLAFAERWVKPIFDMTAAATTEESK